MVAPSERPPIEASESATEVCGGAAKHCRDVNPSADRQVASNAIAEGTEAQHCASARG